jgi:hypothetical protein
MKKAVFIIIFLLFSTCSYAWITDIGIDPLDQTSGAKPLSLGGAYTAASDDVNCIFYNPAGLANTRGFVISAHDDKTFSAGLSYGTDFGNFGVATVYKNQQGILLNESLKASYRRSMALLTYGIGSGNLSIGFAAKGMLMQQLTIPGQRDMASNSGVDYDHGILWKPFSFASIGAMIRNGSGTTFTLGSSEEVYSRSTRVGFILDLLGKNSVFHNEDIGFKAAYDIENGDAGDFQKHNSFYGIETSFGDRFFIRCGGTTIFRIDRDVSGASGGIGIDLGDAELNVTSVRDPLTETQISYLSFSYSPPELAVITATPEVALPLPPPPKDLLRIYSPEDDYVTYDEDVLISGETRPKADVFINGVRAYVDGEGRFTATQPLISGKNLIRVTATLKRESKTVFRKVLRKALVVIVEETEIDKRIDREVLKRKAEIERKEDEIAREKKKGIDTTKKEKLLEEEKKKQREIQAKLFEMKKTVEERKEKVENLVTLGVIEVAPAAKFKIESSITRGEMIAWLVKASGLALPTVEEAVFADVPRNHRFAPAIKAAFDAGLISAPPNGKFRPDDPVKEEEGETFFRAFGIVK